MYAHYGVQYIWVIDPIACTLEAYQLDAGAWLEIGHYTETDQVTAPPFTAIAIDLGDLWMD